MKHILLIVTIQGIFVPSDTIGGVIWSKSLGTFVPIFSVQPYWKLQQEFLSKQREAETHNFQGHVIRVSYYQKDNMVDFEENDTKISGLVGDVWNLLASSLNFTLKPMRALEPTTGTRINGSYFGMLGELYRNETDVIPRVEMFSVRYIAGGFTPALWTSPQRLYAQVEYTYKYDWMLHLFSWRVWYFIIFTYFIMSISTYMSQAIFCYYFGIKQKADLPDHCFYNFAILCKEASMPAEFKGKSRILEVTLGLFCSIIHISFSALIFNYMTNKIYILPFVDLRTLVKQSSYDVVTVNGSIPHLAFTTKQPLFDEVVNANRYIITSTDEEMYEKACSKNGKYALFTAVDFYETTDVNICKLRPIGKSYYSTWIASSISRKLEYKRTLDIGIIKLHEFGFITRLRAQASARNMHGEGRQTPEPIDMSQVSLIFTMLSSAFVLSSIIFIFENLLYAWNCGNIRTTKNKIQRKFKVNRKMGATAVPILVFTILWGIVGIALPCFVPNGPNRGILQVVLILTAFTCWLFWLCCYMAQMNPLIGPKLSNTTILIMAREWGSPIES